MASGGQKGKSPYAKLDKGKSSKKGSKKKSPQTTISKQKYTAAAEPELSEVETTQPSEAKRSDSSKQRSAFVSSLRQLSRGISKETSSYETLKEPEGKTKTSEADDSGQCIRVSASTHMQAPGSSEGSNDSDDDIGIIIDRPSKSEDPEVEEIQQSETKQWDSSQQHTGFMIRRLQSSSGSSRETSPRETSKKSGAGHPVHGMSVSPTTQEPRSPEGYSEDSAEESASKKRSPLKQIRRAFSKFLKPSSRGASPEKLVTSPLKEKTSPYQDTSPGKASGHGGKKTILSPGGSKQVSPGSSASRPAIHLSPEQGALSLAVSAAACASGSIVPKKEAKSAFSPSGAQNISVILEEDERSVSSKDSAPDDVKLQADTTPRFVSPSWGKKRVSPGMFQHMSPFGLRATRSPPQVISPPNRDPGQDLSAFDMPLIAANIPEGMSEPNEYDRPRSSSGSAALKSLLTSKSKSRNKSVDRDDKKEKDKDKKRGFFEQFRPRSKSDVSGLKRPSKKSSLPTERSMDESTLIAQTNLKPFVGSQEIITPMGQILEGQMLNVPEEERIRHKSGPSGYREGGFMSKIRTFSTSESKPPKSPKRPVQSQRSLSPPSSPRAERPGDRTGLSPLKLQSGEPRSAPPGLHRGSVFSDHSQAVHRPDVTNRVASEGSDRMETDDSDENVDQAYSTFMRKNKCYDIIPTSAKLVIFDTQLNVKKAFFALIYNGVRAAPLWDTVSQDYVGMLTITDFISILRRLYKSPNVRMDQLEDHTILNWRDMERERQRPFICIGPDASLYDAVKSLAENHVHRLPVVDEVTGNALYILTHKRILRFLSMCMKNLRKPTFMYSSVKELGIGTYTNVITATPDTTIITALNLFMDNRVSALPVVDSSGEVISIYAKFDVISLAADKSYNNLDITIGEALKIRGTGVDVDTCIFSDTLSSVINKLVKAEVHRLVVVDENNHVEGILSLSDILKYIILKPMEVAPTNAAAGEQAPEDQPPLAEETAIIEESPLLESELMGAEASESSQASS